MFDEDDFDWELYCCGWPKKGEYENENENEQRRKIRQTNSRLIGKRDVERRVVGTGIDKEKARRWKKVRKNRNDKRYSI